MERLLKRYKSLPVVTKATLWFIFSSFLQKCISFITVPVFTRIMTQEQYGLYNAYQSVASVFTVICTMNFDSCGYINGISKEEENKHDEIAINFISLSLVCTSVIFALYLVFHQTFNKLFGVTTLMMLWMFIGIISLPVVRFWSINQRFKYKYIKLVLVTVLMTILHAVLGIGFVIFSDAENQVYARIASSACVQLLFGIIFYVGFASRSHKSFIVNKWRHNLKIHLPLLPHNLSMSLLYTSDRLMINMFCTPIQTAIYSVSYSAGMVVQTLKTCIVDAVRPWMYEKIKENRIQEISVMVDKMMLIVALISFAFSLFAPEIIMILAPKEYYEAIYVIPPVAGSSFFMFLYHLFVSIETYYEKTTRVMIASIIAAITNIVLNAILIPNISYIAAGYTTLLSYALLTLLHYLNVRKIEKSYLESKHLFNFRSIVFISILVTVSITLVSFLYKFNTIRYIIIGLQIISIVIFKKHLLRILKEIRNK